MTTFSSWRARLSGRAALAAVVTIGSTSMLAGCSTSSGSCVDYAAPRPLAIRIAQADLAAVVTFADTGRTVQINAVYPVHEAHVSQILRGQKPHGKVLVTVVPGDCVTTGQPATYADGDPLDRKASSVLLLSGTSSNGVYSLAPWDVVSQDQYAKALRDETTATPSASG